MPTANKRSTPRNIRPPGFWVLEFPDGKTTGYIDKKVAEVQHKNSEGSKLVEYPFKPGTPTRPPGRKMKPKGIIVVGGGADILLGGVEYPEGQAFTRVSNGSYTRV